MVRCPTWGSWHRRPAWKWRVPRCPTFCATLRRWVSLGHTATSTCPGDVFTARAVTLVLQHHLGWVRSVLPRGTRLSHQGTVPTVDNAGTSDASDVARRQLCEYFGMIGEPTRVAKTIVVGQCRSTVCQLLYILSYFIRCSSTDMNARDSDAAVRRKDCSFDHREMSPRIASLLSPHCGAPNSSAAGAHKIMSTHTSDDGAGSMDADAAQAADSVRRKDALGRPRRNLAGLFDNAGNGADDMLMPASKTGARDGTSTGGEENLRTEEHGADEKKSSPQEAASNTAPAAEDFVLLPDVDDVLDDRAVLRPWEDFDRVPHTPTPRAMPSLAVEDSLLGGYSRQYTSALALQGLAETPPLQSIVDDLCYSFAHSYAGTPIVSASCIILNVDTHVCRKICVERTHDASSKLTYWEDTDAAPSPAVQKMLTAFQGYTDLAFPQEMCLAALENRL
eukprot:m.317674 g.317674  ORF g.317674 m.317674 type:complete len:449 (-) comp20284_c0_seq88:2362-3708(-)